MKRFLVLAALTGALASTVSAELPGNVTGNAEFREVWTNYTKSLLERLFPNEPLLQTLNLYVSIADNPLMNTGNLNSTGRREVMVTRGLLLSLKSETEYAAILAHEFGHVKLAHPPTERPRVRVPMSKGMGNGWLSGFGEESEIPEVEHDLALLESQEKEADAFALKTLKLHGFNPCALYYALRFIQDSSGWNENVPMDAIHIRRLTAAKGNCSQ